MRNRCGSIFSSLSFLMHPFRPLLQTNGGWEELTLGSIIVDRKPSCRYESSQRVWFKNVLGEAQSRSLGLGLGLGLGPPLLLLHVPSSMPGLTEKQHARSCSGSQQQRGQRQSQAGAAKVASFWKRAGTSKACKEKTHAASTAFRTNEAVWQHALCSKCWPQRATTVTMARRRKRPSGRKPFTRA